MYKLNVLALSLTSVGAVLGIFFGKINGILIALIVAVILDYISGLISAGIRRQLSSSVGFKGIAKKILIFLIVGIANLIDVYVLGGESAVLRTSVIFFYLANEGISILENAGECGLPIPTKLKDLLVQLRSKSEKEEENGVNNNDGE